MKGEEEGGGWDGGVRERNKEGESEIQREKSA